MVMVKQGCASIMAIQNVSGWNDLIAGNIMAAVYNMFNAATAGWFVAVMFMVFQSVLFIKTRNLTLCWVTGIFFASLFGATVVMKDYAFQLMFVMLSLELAGILAMWFFK